MITAQVAATGSPLALLFRRFAGEKSERTPAWQPAAHFNFHHQSIFTPCYLPVSRAFSVFRTMIASKSSEKIIEIEGKIVSVLAGTMFRVELPNGHLVLAHISGKMRKRFIRLTAGDRVKMQMSPYDTEKARIVYRLG
jgi:translation initiation factor IF-1